MDFLYGSVYLEVMEITTTWEGEMKYELRVDLSDGFEIVKLTAASIEEAVQRASKIWSKPERVTLLAIIDPTPQKFLAW